MSPFLYSALAFIPLLLHVASHFYSCCSIHPPLHHLPTFVPEHHQHHTTARLLLCSMGFTQLAHFTSQLCIPFSSRHTNSFYCKLSLSSGCLRCREWLLKENPPLRRLLHQWLKHDLVRLSPVCQQHLQLRNQFQSRSQGCCVLLIHHSTPAPWR